MKIRCSKRVFERALAAFKEIHSSYEDILITTNDGKVILGPTGGAQSYQFSFMCEYDEQGSVEIDLTILSQIVEQLPDDDMTIEVTPDYSVRLLCGGKKYCCLGKCHITKKRGVFWLIDSELLAIPYDDNSNIGIAKSGDNYNHRLLWDSVKPKKCSKSFDYYPRGRVEISNKGRPIIYMNSNIGEEYVTKIMECFGLTEFPIIHYDGSEHYKCYLDKT